MFETIAIYSGLIATLWIFIGVYVASLFYEGYSHSKQFCSELGATGSPTEKLSPLINNYPLGFLFCFFGWYLTQLSNVSILVLSLVLAPILIAISPTTEITPLYFRVFSIVSVIATVYYLFAMAKAVKLQSNPGTYQRISYGIQLSWLSVFSIVLM